MKITYIFFVGLYFYKSEAIVDSPFPIVNTEDGAVRGETMFGEGGNRFYSFRGIPYAQPPIGNLRFKAPVPKIPWEGILNATKDGPSCPQGDMLTRIYMGSEDCLYLNVYTPTIPENDEALLDVVVNFHGGGFQFLNGSSLIFGPGRFPLDQALLVSLNYRLSALGFLSTNDSAAPGNYGLLDQLQVLRWIQKNIRQFGGDPSKITLLGDSAGSGSVIYQMLSPLSQGLFRRVIAMSGSPISSWALQKEPLYWTQSLAKELHCPINASQDLVECLREKSAREIMELNDNGVVRNLPFFPVIDHYFIDDSALNLLSDRKYHRNVSLMIGATKDEMDCLILFRPNTSADYTKEEILLSLTATVDAIPNNTKYIDRVWNKYFSNLTSFKPSDVNEILGDAVSDGVIRKYVDRTVKILSDTQDQDISSTYFYVYDFYHPLANSFFYNKTGFTGNLGVCHGSDLLMLFDGLWYQADLSHGDGKKMKEKYQKLIIDFVKYGNPTADLEENDVCYWPPVQPDKLHLYHIDVNCSAEIYDEKSDEFYHFWNYDLYNN